MKNLKSFSLALTMLISFLTFGQEKTVTGTVSDQSGPLPGASVAVKGTKNGTSTDFDGTYSIKVKIGDILVFSFIGKNSKSAIVGASNIYNATLNEEQSQLSEVIVVGYGIKKGKNRMKSSPQMVLTKNLYQAANPNIIRGLAGKVSGVQIRNNNDMEEKDRIAMEKNNQNKSIADQKTSIPNDEDYNSFVENPFENPKYSPLSTFSIDVDNASYTNIRRFINNGQKVPKDAVRVEEMMNFFKYQYSQPTDNNPFSINTEYSNCPWNTNHQLLRIGLQGKIIDDKNLPNSNLVFLIDVSGSMDEQNKLPLLIQSLKILVNQLRKEDKVTIVVYAGAAGMVLPPTSGDQKKTIINALDKLHAGGSTAGGAGIELAYKMAQENFIKNGNNRVILATDGDFNVGSSSNGDLETLISEKRKTDIFLTCLGYGMGNYKDSKMEILADKGNGNYAYIDNIQEANRFLGKEFKGSMFAIAKDVKIQIEFNPKNVQSYRLIGYENRKLRPEDFKNDAIDAGELGSGHTVTALYEIIPTGISSEYFSLVDDLKYTKVEETKSVYNDGTSDSELAKQLATIKLRYKKPDGDKSIELVKVIENKNIVLDNSSDDFKFCSAVAWFGLKLRDSKLITNKSNEEILALAEKGLTNDAEGYKAEFIRLVDSE
jgi:Ca-activated chloride channel homolog